MTNAVSFCLLVLPIFSFASISSCYGFGQTKCLLNKLENCDQKGNDAVKLNITIKTIDNKQYVDGTINIMKTFDNTIWCNTSVSRLTDGKFLYLFSFVENKACNALRKYLGEFLYDLERMAQIIPGMCPIQSGKHHLHNAPIQLENIPTLASFPLGTLLLKNNFYDQDNNFFTCSLYEARIS